MDFRKSILHLQRHEQRCSLKSYYLGRKKANRPDAFGSPSTSFDTSFKKLVVFANLRASSRELSNFSTKAFRGKCIVALTSALLDTAAIHACLFMGVRELKPLICCEFYFYSWLHYKVRSKNVTKRHMECEIFSQFLSIQCSQLYIELPA